MINKNFPYENLTSLQLHLPRMLDDWIRFCGNYDYEDRQLLGPVAAWLRQVQSSLRYSWWGLLCGDVSQDVAKVIWSFFLTKHQ